MLTAKRDDTGGSEDNAAAKRLIRALCVLLISRQQEIENRHAIVTLSSIYMPNFLAECNT